MTFHIALGQLEAGIDKQHNLSQIQTMTAESSRSGARLILFPEYAMAELVADPAPANLAEPLDGPFATALSSLARRYDIAVLAGMMEAIPNSHDVYNTIVGFGEDGGFLGAYRKIHLYDAFGFKESDILRRGDGDLVIFDLGDVTFGVQTCYDIRFPEMSRQLVDRGVTCMLVPAAWMQGLLKESHWETLLRARAIENTVYVAAAGLVGWRHCGNSMVVDPMGVVTARAGEVPATVRGEIDPARVKEARSANPSLENRRSELYRTWTHEPARP